MYVKCGWKGVGPINYKYDEIGDRIKHKIQQGIWQVNTPLPPENTLAEEYAVSRITIRHALRKLIEEGYIYSIPGKGNYVLEKTNDKYIFQITPENILKNSYDHSELLGSEIIRPSIDLVYLLRVAPDSRIIRTNWLLYKNKLPVAYDTQYIPYFAGIPLWQEGFTYKSISEIVNPRNQFSESIHITSKLCETRVAEKLEVPEKSHVVLITHIITDDGEPIGMRRLYITKEACRLTGQSYLA